MRIYIPDERAIYEVRIREWQVDHYGPDVFDKLEPYYSMGKEKLLAADGSELVVSTKSDFELMRKFWDAECAHMRSGEPGELDDYSDHPMDMALSVIKYII